MNIDYKDYPVIPCPLCISKEFRTICFRFDSGRIVKCSGCGHIYLNPALPDRILVDIYEQYYSDDSYMETLEQWFTGPQSNYQYALHFIEQKGGFLGKRVLDVGCGPGRFLHECQKKGAFVTGIEISPKAVHKAKEYFNLDLIPKSFERAIIDKDVSSSSFDFIFAFEVIEHVKDPGIFLQALYNLLVPNGLVFISTPNFYQFYLMGKSAGAVNSCSEHLHFFDSASLTKCLERHNFMVKDIFTFPASTYGVRQKQKLIKTPLALNIWKKIRFISLVRHFKNTVFCMLDRYKERADIEQESGDCLIAVAQRQMDKEI